MVLDIKYPESQSRGELLLRTFFGYFYILLPHGLVLLFFGIAASVLRLLAFWVILFTGKYPESWFNFQVKLMRWNLRVSARLLNLADGYPKFGLDAEDDAVVFDVPYPESVSRGKTLLRTFFGWLYVLLPHGFVLYFLTLAMVFVNAIAWWIILFTGKYPQSMFNFVVSVLRWSNRVSIYLNHMTDEYPPFSGAPEAAPANSQIENS